MAKSNKVGELRIEFTATSAKLMTESGKVLAQLDRVDKKHKGMAGSAELSWAKIGKNARKYSLEAVAATGRLSLGLAKGTAALAAFGAGAAALGTARGLVSLSKAATEVDRIGKAADRLGESVENMSALRFAAGQAGIGFEQLESMGSKALRSIARLVSEGQTELRLGGMTVQLTDARGQVRGLTDILPDLAKGIQSARSEAEQLRLAERIFGRGGADEFVTLLRESGDYIASLDRMTALGGRLGVIFTRQDFEVARDFGDAVERIGEAWLGVRVALLREVGPALTEIADEFSLRVAAVPKMLHTVFGVMGYGLDRMTPEQRQVAIERSTVFRGAALDVLQTGAREVGRVIGVTFIEAVAAGLRYLGPEIADVFRDSVGQVLNVIPGVNIQKSNRAQLADMVAKSRMSSWYGRPDQWRAPPTGALTNTLDLMTHGASRSFRPTLGGAAGFGWGSWIKDRFYSQMQTEYQDSDSFNDPGMAWLFGTARTLHNVRTQQAAMRPISNRIDVQRAIVEQERAARAGQKVSAFTEAVFASQAAVEKAGVNFRASLAAFDKSADELEAFYKQLVPPVESQPAAGPTLFDVAAQRWDGFLAWGRRTLDRAREVLPRLRDAVIDTQLAAADLEARRLDALGDPGADAAQLRARQAREMIDMTRSSPALAGMLQGVHEAEFQALARKRAEEQAKNDREITRDARSFAARFDPRIGVEEARIEMDRFRAARPRIITPEVVREFEKSLFEMELAADRTFGGKLLNATYEWRDNVSDAFVELRRTGEINFDALADSYADMLIRMAASELIVTPLAQGLIGGARSLFASGATPPAGFVGPVDTSGGGVLRRADGGWVFRAADGAWVPGPNIPADVVPSLLMPGERVLSHAEVGNMGGVEAVDRAAAGGGQGVTVQVIDQRSGGAPVRVSEEAGPNGERLIRLLIRDEVSRGLGEGAFDGPMRGSFGISRRPGR